MRQEFTRSRAEGHFTEQVVKYDLGIYTAIKLLLRLIDEGKVMDGCKVSLRAGFGTPVSCLTASGSELTYRLDIHELCDQIQ